jgi:hypothetical protein
MMYFLSNLRFGFLFGGVAVDRKLPRSKVSWGPERRAPAYLRQRPVSLDGRRIGRIRLEPFGAAEHVLMLKSDVIGRPAVHDAPSRRAILGAERRTGRFLRRTPDSADEQR